MPRSIAESASDGSTIRLPPVLMQPVAAADVAAALLQVVADAPLRGPREVADPEPFRMDELAVLLLLEKLSPAERPRTSSAIRMAAAPFAPQGSPSLVVIEWRGSSSRWDGGYAMMRF
jgi:hypothetical protein